MTRRGGINTSLIGLLLLIVTMVTSVVVVVRNTLAIESPSQDVLRICHWQLEAGYREAMDAVIADYEKLHPGVQVVQMPVTEKVYTQWINTQLIAGTAPDLVEMGHSNLSVKDEYTVRFFTPIGNEVVKPNPYNQGTALDGVPWKETFIDGMRGGFKDNLEDYYMAPTTLTSMRLYCNTNLLAAATGSGEPPKSFGEFIEQCKKVRKYSLESGGGGIIPLVSCYDSDGVTGQYYVPFTASYEKSLDLDLDGTINNLEMYRGFLAGQCDFTSPNMSAYFHAMKDVTNQMQKGFSSMDRQQAQFHFVNGTAAFMSTGSWDAGGTFLGAKQYGINIKLIRFPLPAPGEPYSEFVIGRQNEAAARGQGAYGVFKNSKHYKLALDFMQFLTSVKANEKLNKLSDWPPIIIGSEPSETMKPFMPSPIGYTSSVNLRIGTKIGSLLKTQSDSYYSGDISYDAMAGAYNKGLRDPKAGGDWAIWNDYDQRWRNCRNQETLLDRDTTEQLMAPGNFSGDDYRRTLFQQIKQNNGADFNYEFSQFRHMPIPEF